MAKDASIKKRFQMPRGTACKVCRKRKVKCDAVRPQCTRCIQALEIHARFPNEPLPEPCQYDPPRSYSGIGGRKKANVLASSEASTSSSAAPRQKRPAIRSTEALDDLKEEQNEDNMDEIEMDPQNTEQAIRRATTHPIERRPSIANRNQGPESSPISVEVVKKLVELFFERCLIASIVDRFSVEETIANKGGPDSMSLLRAILSHSVFYCSQEEASQSLWNGEETGFSNAQELSVIHSMAAKKGMSSSLKSEDEELESSLPIYLLLVSSGIKSSSQQVLSDLSFASLSIKRLGFWALPRLSSLQIPAISNPSISSAHNKMRNSLFWFFIILDRQVQVKFSIPPFLSDCVRQTPLPFEDREKSMSIVDSTVLNPSPQQESWTLLIQSMILIGKTVSRKPTTDGLSPLLSTLSSLHGQSSLENDTSLVSLQSRIQIKSGKVREVSIRLEKGKSASSSSDSDPIHSSRIRLLTSGTILRTCELIIQEADALLPNDVSLARARSTSQDAARIVKEDSPVEIRFVDPILANCWFITARFLIRQISANQVLASEMKEVENGLLDLLLALSRWGDIYPSGKLLSKSLLALLRLSLNRKLGFVLPPSHFAPEAKLLIAEEDRSSTWGETKERYTSLQELAGQIDNEELDRFIMDGRVR